MSAGCDGAADRWEWAPHIGASGKAEAWPIEAGGERDEDSHCAHLSDGDDDSGAERVCLRWERSHRAVPA